MQISREKRRMQSNGDKCGYYHLTEKERELRNQHRTQGKQTEGEESIISERSRTEGKKEKTMNQTKKPAGAGGRDKTDDPNPAGANIRRDGGRESRTRRGRKNRTQLKKLKIW